MYIVVEFLGGLCAGGFFLVTIPDGPNGEKAGAPLVISPGQGVSNLSAIFTELIAAFILVLIVFRVAAGIKEPAYEHGMTSERFQQIQRQRRQVAFKKFYLPIGIAATLGFLAYPTGYLSGGAYNPARALGGCVAGDNCSDIWIYFLGDFFGGALAGLFHYWFFEWPHHDEDIDISNLYTTEGDNL